MQKNFNNKMWHAISCLLCAAVLWFRLDAAGSSEFSGGWLTGVLSKMSDLAGVLFLLALATTFFFRRIATTTALIAAFLCLPFYLYFVMPGFFRWIFKGEYSVPLYGLFYWDKWAAAGITSLLLVMVLSVRRYSND
jgi:hypothetical protein